VLTGVFQHIAEGVVEQRLPARKACHVIAFPGGIGKGLPEEERIEIALLLRTGN